MNIDLLLAAARHIEQQASVFKTDSDRREEDTEGGTLVNSVTSAHIHRHHAQQQPPQSESRDPSRHPDRIATLDGLSGPAASGSSSPDDVQERRIRPSAGMREVHNKLEKNRRAHLKECFDYLRDQVPALQDRRSSNLGILRGALRCIASLKRREQHLELQMERLAGQKIANQQRLGQLRRDAGARWDRVSPAASSVASPDDRPQNGPAAAASPDALTTSNSGNNGERGGSPRCRRRRLSGITSSTVDPHKGEEISEPLSCKRLRTDADGSPAPSPASVAGGHTVSAAPPVAASTTQLMLCSTAAGAIRPVTVVSTAPPPVLLRPAVPQLQQHSRLLVTAQRAVSHSPPGLGGLAPARSFPGDSRRPPLLTRAERTLLSTTTASRTLLLDTLPARLLPGQLVAPSIPVVAGTSSGGGKVQLLAPTGLGLVSAAAVSGARGLVTTPAISGPSVFSRVSRALLAVPASRQLAAPSIASASRTLITLSPAPQPSPGRATTYLTVHQQPRASSSVAETAVRTTGRNTSAVVVIPTVPTSAATATVTRLHVPGSVTRLVASPLPRLVAQQPSTQPVTAAAPSTHCTPAATTGSVLSQRGDKVMKQVVSSKRQVVKRVTPYISSGNSQAASDNDTAARGVVSTPTVSSST